MQSIDIFDMIFRNYHQFLPAYQRRIHCVNMSIETETRVQRENGLDVCIQVVCIIFRMVLDGKTRYEGTLRSSGGPRGVEDNRGVLRRYWHWSERLGRDRGAVNECRSSKEGSAFFRLGGDEYRFRGGVGDHEPYAFVGVGCVYGDVCGTCFEHTEGT